jgi:uncharacterized iron-regulated membrane protein
MLKWSLQLHKWIGLIVGLQILFWIAGGLVMSALPIERVRGENHVRQAAKPVLPLGEVISLKDLAAKAELDGISDATLKATPQGPMWILNLSSGAEAYFNARTGGDVRELTAAEAQAAAAAAYQGSGTPSAARYLETAPQEAGVSGPLYAVTFSDPERSVFYLDAFTGEVRTRRSNLWRFYDVFWRLHIMDWKNGQNFNHPLIIAAAALSLAIVVTGLILLWIRLARDLSRVTRRPQRA